MRGSNHIRRRSIWICDKDSMYLNMLHGYLKERIGLPLGIADFTDVKYLSEKPETEEVLLLIISEEMLAEIDLDEYENVLILTEGESARLQTKECAPLTSVAKENTFEESDNRRSTCHAGGRAGIRTVSRYSKAADILNEVLHALSGSRQMQGLCMTGELSVQIIGFYSPLGRCLQTQTAMAMGQLLAETDKTLYMNFSPFPEERLVRLGRGENMADLMYYYDCAPDGLTVKLFQALADVGGLKVIPPAPSYMQIADVSSDEWMRFICEVCKVSACRYLILDLSEALPCLFELLGMCEKIYTICGRDRYDAAKMLSYKNFLSIHEQSKLLEKTIFTELPSEVHTPFRLSELGASELGEFLKKSGYMHASNLNGIPCTNQYAQRTNERDVRNEYEEDEGEDEYAEEDDDTEYDGKGKAFKKKSRINRKAFWKRKQSGKRIGRLRAHESGFKRK